MQDDILKCGDKRMIYDEACLHIANVGSVTQTLVDVHYQNTECFQCSLEPLMKLGFGEEKSKIVPTSFGTILNFSFNNSFHRETYFFEQHGHYKLEISENDVSELLELSPPDNANGPFYILLWTLIVGWILWSIGSCIFTYTQLYTRIFQPRLIINEVENDLGPISRSGDSTPLILDSTREITALRRIQSLDVFRGITITLMLFVNYGGGNYWFFQHSSWNGLTVADVIFPWFAWIMGTSIMLSLSSHLRNSVSRKRILLKVFLRSIALFVIGITLNSFKNNNIVTLRVPGVLQRLALAYLIVGSIETCFVTIQNRYDVIGRIKKVEDWIYGWIQWLIMLTLLGIYCAATFYTTVPGCPNGYLGPGGLHQNSSFTNCTGGSAGYIDRFIFSNQHLYNGTIVSSVYHNKLPFDPEGLLGTLTTAFTVFLGVHAGRIILCYRTPEGRVIRWFIMALITGAIAGHLSGWSKEGGAIPLNKNLWSISFALATSSLAFCVKSILFLLVDCHRWWSGSPFQQVGKNSIFIYIGSIITKEAIPWNWTPMDYSTHSWALWMNVWSTVLWIIIAIVLDWWKIYINI